MDTSQIWRFPKKYGELFRNISDEDIGIIIRELFLGDGETLAGLNKAYFDIIKVDLDNLEKSAVNGKKGGRPKKKKTTGYENKKPQVIEKQNLKESEEKENVKVKDKEIVVSKETETIVSETTYGNKEINEMLAFLCRAIGIDQFKESQKIQRQYANHLVNFANKNGKEDFIQRIKGILEDDFKRKNCNSIKYFYGEIKSYIHTPLQSNGIKKC